MSQGRKIREGPIGTSSRPAENIIPVDAKKLPLATKSFEFYFHNKNGKSTIYIYITNYHPGILEIPLEKLEEAINYLRGE